MGLRFTPKPALYHPTHFHARMEEVFGGRLRLRWSVRHGCWFIEQKVGRAALKPIRIQEWDDSLIQARDGYALVMVIQPGTRMACPFCHLPIDVPLLETREAVCTHCTSKGRDAKFMTAYYPLGEVLIDHLKSWDPERQPEILDRIRREEAEALKALDREHEAGHREAGQQLKDGLLDQLPKAGFPSLVPDGWRH